LSASVGWTSGSVYIVCLVLRCLSAAVTVTTNLPEGLVVLFIARIAVSALARRKTAEQTGDVFGASQYLFATAVFIGLAEMLA
jgi:cobalamin synthase